MADEPELYNEILGVEVVKGDASDAIVCDGTLSFRNVEKAWVYTTDGKLVKFVQNPKTINVDFASGLYIVKMQNKNVIRSQKLTVK